jgi:riboflavin synthase
MFTGIIELRGTVVRADGDRLAVDAGHVSADSDVGASVAVNGVCLTVVARDGNVLSFDVSNETRERSGLGALRVGDPVNLERPVSLAARLGGHLVQGHVDGVGRVETIQPDEDGGARFVVRMPADLGRYVVEKGSITVDGVSLTVAKVDDRAITIALVPHTLAVTTLGVVEPGDDVNLEVDVIAKYVERAMEGKAG